LRYDKQQEVAMYPRDIRVNNPTEALLVEQALAMVREMQETAEAAPDGRVLREIEQLAITRGREFMQKSLEAVANDQAEVVEKKGRRAGRVRVAARESTEGGGSDPCSRPPAP
jgi:hypothetical protein